MPKKDGQEVLHDIKSDSNLRRIPVVILTTSDDDEDILKSYDLGANCYVTKSLGLDQFAKIVQFIEEFWLTVVRLLNEGRTDQHLARGVNKIIAKINYP